MWKQVKTKSDIEELIFESQNFHDCCLHSMEYSSGAYVNKDGSMYPINSSRILTMQMHQQGSPAKVLQLRFEGLQALVLSPTSPDYTCELLEGYVILQNDEIILSSDGLDVGTKEQRLFIRASQLRWKIEEMG